ncbi:MAG: hypothetical protein ACOC0C_07185, partial [Bacteroidota bacterium]
MNSKTKHKINKKKWAVPGNDLSLTEFKKGIKNAEKGPFYTIEEAQQLISEWRKKRSSKVPSNPPSVAT